MAVKERRRMRPSSIPKVEGGEIRQKLTMERLILIIMVAKIGKGVKRAKRTKWKAF